MIFTKFGKGTPSKLVQLQDRFLVLDSRSSDKDDYVLYDKNSGILSYNPDESGSKIPIEFAQLKKGTILAYQDPFVVRGMNATGILLGLFGFIVPSNGSRQH
jgi:hypothetical protein